MRSLKLLEWKIVLVSVMSLGLQSNSCAIDSASLEFASGNRTQMLRIATQWMWNDRWWQSNATHIGGYWDLSLAQWHGNTYTGNADEHQNLISVGITPVFRFQNDSKTGFYSEAAIGLHLLSDSYNNNRRSLSGNLQFGDHIGIGYVFKNNLDISFKFQHFSNGGIKKPNDGVNFAILRVSQTF